MPIYEYVCNGCRTRFEKLVRRFGEEVSCPACKDGAVERQLSVFAVGTAAAPALAGCGGGDCREAGGGCCGAGACGLPS